MVERVPMRSRRLTLDLTEAQYDAMVAGLRSLRCDDAPEAKTLNIEAAIGKLNDAWYGRAAKSPSAPGAV